jgi:CshA-type fibril repeat protein
VTFSVPTIDDILDEIEEENLTIHANVTEGTVVNPTSSATGTILDNDVMTQEDTLISDVSGVPTSINILENDSNSTNPQSINLIPHENAPEGTTTTDTDGDGDIDTIIVPGEGVWSVDDDGIVTFTPEDGFTGDPTPIDYTVEDDHGHISKPTQIQADYPQTSTLANDDNMSGNVGDEISINVLENDIDQEDDINISSVNLIVPETLEGTTQRDTDGDGDIDRIVVPGEGVWSVDNDGIVTFTPEDGFTGDPTPISYTVKDDTNEISNQAIIRVDFVQELRDDNKTGIMHRPVEILILDNDDKVDPSSVNLHASESATEDDTNNDGDIDKITVPGEGVWSMDENATLVFVPEVSFEGDPTSITYTAEDENKNPAGSAMVNIHYVGIGGLIEPQAVDDTLTVLSNKKHSGNAAENDIAGEGGKDKQIYHLLDPDTGIEIAVGEKVKLHYGIISMQTNGHYTYVSYVNVEGGEDTIKYSMKDTLDQTSSANILIKVACTSSQLSDSGGNKNIVYLLLMFLFLGMIGLYNIRKEEKSL